LGVNVILPAMLPATSIEEPNHIKAVPSLVCLRHKSECLNAHWFMCLADATEKCEDWRRDYNEVRPHSAIGNKSPVSLLNCVGADTPPMSEDAGKSNHRRGRVG
jgi:putative transposase